MHEFLRGTIYFKEIEYLKDKKYIIYPTTTSSQNSFAHQGEINLIENLCQETQGLGIKLYIKPKPNGSVGDYDEFKKYTHVIIGPYARNVNAIDLLDDNYNIYRYLLLKYSYLMINVGTTFGIEGALLNIPIMQLILDDEMYKGFAQYSKNPHIEKYLHNQNCIQITKLKSEHFSQINQFIDYSKDLKKWLIK